MIPGDQIAPVIELLTGEQVAQRLGLSRERVRQLTGRPDFPPEVGRIGKAVVWRASDVDAYARGIRTFVSINRVSIPLDRAKDLAVRLEHLTGSYPSVADEVARDLRAAIASGGRLAVTDQPALAVWGALQEMLLEEGVDTFGRPLMDLRYRLFGELQDAGLLS